MLAEGPTPWVEVGQEKKLDVRGASACLRATHRQEVGVETITNNAR